MFVIDDTLAIAGIHPDNDLLFSLIGPEGCSSGASLAATPTPRLDVQVRVSCLTCADPADPACAGP